MENAYNENKNKNVNLNTKCTSLETLIKTYVNLARTFCQGCKFKWDAVVISKIDLEINFVFSILQIEKYRFESFRVCYHTFLCLKYLKFYSGWKEIN